MKHEEIMAHFYNPLNTLVFEGGSVKGLVYVGALKAFDAHYRQCCEGNSADVTANAASEGLLGHIQHVGGTSAGSIMALLVAMGLSLEQIDHVMQNTAFSTFADMGRLAKQSNLGKAKDIYSYGYLCEGQVFMEWAEGLLQEYVGDSAITFKGLQEKTGKGLHVYAVRLNDGQVIEFSGSKTPDMPVALAIRASMSIPIFFKPVRIKEILNGAGQVTALELDDNGTTYYVDGGVKANYPYQLIKQSLQQEDKNLLGFKVDSDVERLRAQGQPGLAGVERAKREIQGGHGNHIIPHILSAMTSPQEDQHYANAVEKQRTVYSSDCGVSTFDFELSPEQIQLLLAAGSNAAMQYIANLEQIQQSELRFALPALSPSEKEANGLFEGSYTNLETKRVAHTVQAIRERVEQTGLSGDAEITYIENLKRDIVRLRATVPQVEKAMKSSVVPLIGEGAVINAEVKIKQEFEGTYIKAPNAAQAIELVEALKEHIEKELAIAASKISSQIIGPGAIVLQRVDVEQRARACKFVLNGLPESQARLEGSLKQIDSLMVPLPVPSEAFRQAVAQAIGEGDSAQFTFTLKRKDAKELKIQIVNKKMSGEQIENYLKERIELLDKDLRSNQITVNIKEKNGVLTIQGEQAEIDRTAQLLRISGGKFLEGSTEKMRHTGFFRWEDRRTGTSSKEAPAVLICSIQ